MYRVLNPNYRQLLCVIGRTQALKLYYDTYPNVISIYLRPGRGSIRKYLQNRKRMDVQKIEYRR